MVQWAVFKDIAGRIRPAGRQLPIPDLEETQPPVS